MAHRGAEQMEQNERANLHQIRFIALQVFRDKEVERLGHKSRHGLPPAGSILRCRCQFLVKANMGRISVKLTLYGEYERCTNRSAARHGSARKVGTSFEGGA